jgi:hypothetical protein
MSFKEMHISRMFATAEKTVKSFPEAVEAAGKDVKENFDLDLDTQAIEGLMVCGIVLFLTTMQKVQQFKAAQAAAQEQGNE